MHSVIKKILLFIMLAGVCLFRPYEASARQEEPEYEVISLVMRVERFGNFNSDAIYTPDGRVFLPVEPVFNTLKIQCNTVMKGRVLEGFIRTEDNRYSINYDKGLATVGKDKTGISKKLIMHMGLIYMDISMFGELFGLEMEFSFRSLTILIKPGFELPVIKEQRLEKIRKNINRYQQEQQADTVLQREVHMLKLGMLDWSLQSSQVSGSEPEHRAGIGLGAELLGGEANVYINYSSRFKLDKRMQQYNWKWVNNDRQLLKQVSAGKINTQTISSVYYPVAGTTISNSPTTVRKSYGTYEITDFTEPGWLVELYINDVLTDFTRSDASGMFSFSIPLSYGFNNIELRFYGPAGEERSETKSINLPYNFIPAKKFEYRLTGGFLQDGNASAMGRAEGYYGINRIFTAGAGIEYLSSINGNKYIPFVNISFMPAGSLMFKGEYAHGVRTKALLNFYLNSSTSIEIDYTRYRKGQKAVLYNYLEEKKVTLSTPFSAGRISGYTKLAYKQNVYPNFRYNMTETLLSAYYKQFNFNLSAYANWLNDRPLYLSTQVTLSYRTRNGYSIRPSAQFNLTDRRPILYKAEIERRFGNNSYVSLSYEDNVAANICSVNFIFKYNLPFAQINTSARASNTGLSSSQGASGSLAFGSGNNRVISSYISNMSRGGISLVPFVDINHNGVFDSDEPYAENLNARVSGGRTTYSDKDPIIRITGLEPFTYYNLELSDAYFENIAWRLENKTYRVMIDPNQFKIIEIPVTPVGEVNGMVGFSKDGVTTGLGRILVNIYDSEGRKVWETISESDGYFSILGLEPGNYIACTDSLQLKDLGYTVTVNKAAFTINESVEGDIVSGIEFTLSSPEITIQSGAFRNEKYARILYKKLTDHFSGKKEIFMLRTDDYYKVRIKGFKDSEETDNLLEDIRSFGVNEIWVLPGNNTNTAENGSIP